MKYAAHITAILVALLLAASAAAQAPVYDPADNETNTPNPATESPQVSLSDGILLIVGTEGDDLIKLTSQAGGSRPVVVNTWDFSTKKWKSIAQFPKANVTAIHAHLFGGNDQFLASPYGHLHRADVFPMVVHSGAGSDTIHTGHGSDMVTLEGAFNVAITGAGNDIVQGSDGHDNIQTEHGDDQVLAGGGNDLVMAGPGEDYVDGGDGADFVYSAETADNVEFLR